MKIIRSTAFFALFALALTFTACTSATEPKTKTYYEYFDTVSTVTSYAKESEAQFDENAAAVEDSLKNYHRLFDVYYEYSGINNLKTVNDNAGVTPVKVDSAIIDLLLYAKEIYTLTRGETNVAMGSVLRLWHEERQNASDGKNAALPSDDSLKNAAKHTFIDSLIIDEGASTVFVSDPSASIDVGAIAKGYAVERTAELLESRGAESYVLNVGGNIRMIGAKPDGKGWITGITDPQKREGGFALRLILSNTSCVTSGNYERYYTVDGKNYHHIIDKDTLYPAAYFASVSVITPDSALADALSTALFCMTYEEGIELVGSLEGTEVIWIYENGNIKTTDGIKDLTAK